MAGSGAVSDPCAHPYDGTHTSGESHVHVYAFANHSSGHSNTNARPNRDSTRSYRRAVHAYQFCHLDQFADAGAKRYAYECCHLDRFADAVAKFHACQFRHLHQLADAVTKLYADLDTDWWTGSDPATYCYGDGRGRHAHRRER